MPEVRDSAIKLFGRAIPLSEEFASPVGGGASDLAPAMEENKDDCKEKFAFSGELKLKEPAISYGLKISGEHELGASTVNAEEAEELMLEHDRKETDTSDQNKVLKKPDKILPCPRCNSMDTKFCYYNNYNVNQPRHFCKNCQRYWTAGGTMRNVPVGAGRRKNKHSCSDYNQTPVTSDFLVSAQVDNSDLTHLHPLSFEPHATEASLNGNGTVLKFEPELTLYESKASVMNLGDHKRSSEEPSCSSSVDASNHVDNGTTDIAEHNAMQGYFNGVMLMRHLQCFPYAWAYPLNPGWNNVNAASAASTAAGVCSSDSVSGKEKSFPTPMPWNPSHSMASPALYAPAFLFPLAPASFWGSMPCWNPPWIESCNGLSPLSSAKTDNCSGNNSPTLGKHSRDAGLNREGNLEKSLWFPKTLRIDDPDEAAMSPIFATLGIKPYEAGVFQSFQPKFGNEKATGSSHVLCANPAALSRSQTFQETG